MMNDKQIIKRIQNLRTLEAGPGPACSDDHQIAAFVDGKLSRVERDGLIHHIADCGSCVSRIGMLNRLRAVEDQDAVQDITLARARRLVRRAGIGQLAPRWAAAAVIVLAVALTVGKFSNDNAGPESSPSFLPPVASVRQSRNINPDAIRPRFLIPHEGAVIDIGNTRFRWTEIPDSLYYDVRIVTGAGDMVWQDRIDDTRWVLPGHLELESGVDYYVRVDAYLAEAKSVSSRHLLFRVRE